MACQGIRKKNVEGKKSVDAMVELSEEALGSEHCVPISKLESRPLGSQPFPQENPVEMRYLP